MTGNSDGRAENLRSVLLLFLFTVLMAAGGWLRHWDQLLYDLQLGLLPGKPVADIVIVAVDEQSLERLGPWPWSRDLHARLVSRLTQAGARAIVLDLPLAANTAGDPEKDKRLIQAVAASDRVFLPMTLQWRSLDAEPIASMPLPALANVAAGLGHKDLAPDHDGVVRGFYLFEGVGEASWPHMMLVLRQWLQPGSADEPPVPLASQRSESQQVSRRGFRLIPFTGAGGSYPRYSYSRVLEGDYPGDLFQDRIVLVGITAGIQGDGLPTSLSGRESPMPEVEIQAHILDGLLQERTPRPVGFLVHLTFSGLIVVLALVLYAYIPVRFAPLVAGGMLLFFLLLDWGLLHIIQRWFPPSPVILGLLLSYPLWRWHRLRQTLIRVDRQLVGLQQGQTARTQSRSSAELVAAIEFMGRLMPLRGWVLYAGESRIEAAGDELGEPMAFTATERWRRSGAELWFLINRDRELWRLGMLWPRNQVPQGRGQELLLDMTQQFNQGGAEPSDGLPAQVERHVREIREMDLRQRLRHLLMEETLEHLDEGLILINSLGRVALSNPGAVRHLGGAEDEDYAGVEAAGLLSRLEFNTPFTWQDVWQRVLLGGESIYFEGRNALDREISLRIKPLDVAQTDRHGMLVNLSYLRQRQETDQT